MNSEQIKEEFLKSYNCSSMKEFKHTKLTSEKFYEIMEDYFTKCLYNQKYKEVIDKLNKLTNMRLLTMYFEDGGEISVLSYKEILDILKEVE